MLNDFPKKLVLLIFTMTAYMNHGEESIGLSRDNSDQEGQVNYIMFTRQNQRWICLWLWFSGHGFNEGKVQNSILLHGVMKQTKLWFLYRRLVSDLVGGAIKCTISIYQFSLTWRVQWYVPRYLIEPSGRWYTSPGHRAETVTHMSKTCHTRVEGLLVSMSPTLKTNHPKSARFGFSRRFLACVDWCLQHVTIISDAIESCCSCCNDNYSLPVSSQQWSFYLCQFPGNNSGRQLERCITNI